MVVHVPETDGRLNVLHLFDPYTETHATIGEDAPACFRRATT